jgi:hypothetical protein
MKNIFIIKSHNPRSDFRAGGYLSLLFINFFAGIHKENFEKMNNTDSFLTAVCAIRLIVI